MKKIEPQWMKECREAAIEYCECEDIFVEGALWLSRYLISRRVSKGGKARAKALTAKEREGIARMGGESGGRGRK
jgi:hypothetical protein